MQPDVQFGNASRWISRAELCCVTLAAGAPGRQPGCHRCRSAVLSAGGVGGTEKWASGTLPDGAGLTG